MGEKEYLIEEIRSSLAIEVTDDQAEQMVRFFQMLEERNRDINLTRIVNFEDAVKKHFVDSLSAVKLVPFSEGNIRSCIDVGSGAGFPGIPLKIVWPELDVVMADSVGKKVDFIKDAIKELGLHGAEAVHARAEDLGQNKAYRERFDLCVSRAVANMSTLSEYCLPLVSVGGCFAAYKSGTADEEIREAGHAINALGGKIERIERFSLFDMQRILVSVRKTAHTGKQYPRKAGTPSRTPL